MTIFNKDVEDGWVGIHNGLNGWNRWESILKFVEAEDHSHLLPDFKEYVNNLDRIRNIDAKQIFSELGHLL